MSAYASLGLEPRRLYRLTPSEFRVMCQGFERRSRRELRLLGIHAAWILNAWRDRKKKPTPITVDDLVKRDEPTKRERPRESLGDILSEIAERKAAARMRAEERA